MGEARLVFVDANIFLELMFDDKKADECENFLIKIRNKEIEAETTDFIIYTCLLQIQQKLKSLNYMQKFILLIGDLNLNIIRPSLEDIYDATKIVEKYNLDFDDSLIVSCMKSNNIKTLISLDKHFDKVDFIKRSEP